MKLFNKRNIAVGIVALVIGVMAVFGISKAFNSRTESVTGNVAAFVLNPEGKVDGAILDTGDQVSFGAETGLLVTQQIKVGDRLLVTGRAGSKSDYGREFRAETVQIGDSIINVIHPKPMPREGRGRSGRERGGDKGQKGRKPMPPRDERPDAPQPNAENPVGEDNRENGEQPVESQFEPRETVTANGNVRFVLVGKGGEARGLILSDGTQVALPKEVKKASLTFSEQTVINVEGEAAKSDFGTFIKPIHLTIGDRAFSFNR